MDLPDTSTSDEERICVLWEDQSAFIELYQRHYDAVLRYALRRTSAATAYDVVADTFLVAWRKPGAVPSEPLPWLYGVARRVLANERRRLQRSADLELRLQGALATCGSRAGDDPSDSVAERQRVLAAFMELSAVDQELLRLTAWEDLDARAAAEVLNCSLPTVYVRLHRARRRLEKALTQQDNLQMDDLPPQPLASKQDQNPG